MAAQLDQLITGVAELDTPELETLISQANLLLSRRKNNSLSSQETKLLQAINQTLPVSVELRYSELQDKVQNETITPEEHEELMELVDITEQADADRLQALLTLSQIRQISLPALMEQLGLSSPPIRG